MWRRLHDEAGRCSPHYFGYDGARARFLHRFPDGFHSDGFAATERQHKLTAKNKLDAAAPVEDAATGSGSGSGSGFGEAVLSPTAPRTCSTLSRISGGLSITCSSSPRSPRKDDQRAVVAEAARPHRRAKLHLGRR